MQAWFGGMLYQIQPLVVALGINASWRQSQPSAQGCVMEQVVLLHECVRQFLQLKAQLWSMYRRVLHGDQWLEGYNVKGVLRWFPMLFHDRHVE